MNENRLMVPITSTLCPDYYPDFHCAAGDCRYTCCQGWRISFSKKDYLALKRAPRTPELKARMEKALQRLRGEGMGKENLYAQFCLDENDSPYCPLRGESGLCLLQLECGEDALPSVCRTFPRHQNYTSAGTYEQSCSTGCEVVTKALLARPDGLTFLQTPLPPEERKTCAFSNPTGLLQWFGPIREMCIDILQDRSHPLSRRLLLLGLALRELQTRQTQGKLSEIDSWLAYSHALLTDDGVRAALIELPGNKDLFVFNNLNQVLSLSYNSNFIPALQLDVLSLLNLRTAEEDTSAADISAYIDAEQQLFTTFQDLEHTFESLLVNIFFQKKYPDLAQPEQLWNSYVNFCNLYGLFRFLTVCGCARDQTTEHLIHVLTVISRELLHSGGIQSDFTLHYEHKDSNSLAHMAILVCG